jgi:FAD/FMN-containing dehydrogenase
MMIDETHSEYHRLRKVWNGLINKYPKYIVQCKTEQEIQQAVHFAKEHELTVAVRGGGHSFSGFGVCDGGLVIDLSLMNGVTVNLEEKTVCVQGGALWADVDNETCKYNLAVPGGVVSHTGVGGLCLGGGIGWLSRSYGLTCDNIVSARVVTEDGRIVVASETENSDLLWALKGAGSNFGVVCSFTFKLYNVTKLESCQLIYPIENAQQVLEWYFEKNSETLPDNVIIYGFVTPASLIIYTMYHEGDITLGKDVTLLLEGYQRLVNQLVLFNPIECLHGPTTYLEYQTIFDVENSHEKMYYSKSLFFKESLNPQAISKLIDFVKQCPIPQSCVEIVPMGGIISHKPNDATAFYQRDATYEMHCMSSWTDSAIGVDVSRQWGRQYFNTMREYSCNTTGYINTAEHDEIQKIDIVKNAYGSNYERLQQVKQRYDPSNFFHNNCNIIPDKNNE